MKNQKIKIMIIMIMIILFGININVNANTIERMFLNTSNDNSNFINNLFYVSKSFNINDNDENNFNVSTIENLEFHNFNGNKINALQVFANSSNSEYIYQELNNSLGKNYTYHDYWGNDYTFSGNYISDSHTNYYKNHVLAVDYDYSTSNEPNLEENDMLYYEFYYVINIPFMTLNYQSIDEFAPMDSPGSTSDQYLNACHNLVSYYNQNLYYDHFADQPQNYNDGIVSLTTTCLMYFDNYKYAALDDNKYTDLLSLFTFSNISNSEPVLSPKTTNVNGNGLIRLWNGSTMRNLNTTTIVTFEPVKIKDNSNSVYKYGFAIRIQLFAIYDGINFNKCEVAFWFGDKLRYDLTTNVESIFTYSNLQYIKQIDNTSMFSFISNVISKLNDFSTYLTNILNGIPIIGSIVSIIINILFSCFAVLLSIINLYMNLPFSISEGITIVIIAIVIRIILILLNRGDT